MFNIDEEKYEKYDSFFPDELANIADNFNDFENETDEILLFFNQYLKFFPVINKWRIDVFNCWDICRRSLVCASQVYKEELEGIFTQIDIYTKERIYYESIVEYYIENVVYRIFSILEKTSHPANILLNLNFNERKVSFNSVLNVLEKNHVDKTITKLFQKIDDRISKSKVLEVRHSYIHRNDPMNPSYEIQEIEINMKESCFPNDRLVINTAIEKDPLILSIDLLYVEVLEIYKELTVFVKGSFDYYLNYIVEQYEKEREEFLDR